MSGHSIMGGAYFQIVVSQNSSIQSRCVIWDPFSSDLGSICDTICLQTRVSLDPKTQCGWQSTEKKAERISFTHKNTTTTTSTTIYFLEVCIIRTVATLQKNIKTCLSRFDFLRLLVVQYQKSNPYILYCPFLKFFHLYWEKSKYKISSFCHRMHTCTTLPTKKSILSA